MEVDIPSLFVLIIGIGILWGYVVWVIVGPALRDRHTRSTICMERHVSLGESGMECLNVKLTELCIKHGDSSVSVTILGDMITELLH